jgi:hypothetical protein
MSREKTGIFKLQFPIIKGITETSPAKYCTENGAFVDYDLDIGWAFQIENLYKKNGDEVVTKNYCGATHCQGNRCRFFNKEMRLP